MRKSGMWFDTWHDLARILIIALSAYVAVVLILRVTGKRSLAKLNAFDFIVTIALGSIMASVILLKDISLAEGLTALLALTLLQFVVTWISRRSPAFAGLVRSDPRLLLRDGRFLEEALTIERVTHGEVEAAIRKKGHGRIEEISAVVLESDGTFSVLQEQSASDCTALRSVIGPEKKGE